jgi:carbon monoxide dehydrogenase subunit G
MNGEQRIAASREQVWQALNDPDVLKQCIPGCQSLEWEDQARLKASVAIKVGAISAKFAGAVTLSDLDPPSGYRISGEGQSGAAGFAKGAAQVRLTEGDETTLLVYEVEAQVGGRLAQLGGAVIDATAKQLAGSFFKRLGQVVAQPADIAPGPSLAEVQENGR